MAEQPFDKEIMCVTHEFNQPSQQKPRIEMGLLPAESLPVDAKVNRKK